jgi:hypothetical protein
VSGEQWAKVPEKVAYMGLDATALNVFIILAAKAGRDRIGWMPQATMGERLGKARRTVGDAMKRLRKADLIRPAGIIVVDSTTGRWLRKWQVAPYLHEGDVGTPSGGDGKGTMAISGGDDGDIRVPDGGPGTPHSVPVVQSPYSERLDEEGNPTAYRGSALDGKVRKVGGTRMYPKTQPQPLDEGDRE